MKRLPIAILAAFVSCAAFADNASETRLSVDLTRPASFSWTWTRNLDTAIRMTVKRGGDEFAVTGRVWSIVLGGADSGFVCDGVRTAYNEVLFDIHADALPTNGRYVVQLMVNNGTRSEEIGRGNLTVRLNPAMDYMPSCWMGYQKVARLASYFIQMDVITNAVIAALSTNSAPSASASASTVDFTDWTNHCLRVTKSKVPEMPIVKRFVWDGSNTEVRVMRCADFPAGRFVLPGAWSPLTNSYFEISAAVGEPERFHAERVSGQLWYKSAADESRKFMVKPAFVGNRQRNEYLNGE